MEILFLSIPLICWVLLKILPERFLNTSIYDLITRANREN